MYNVYLCQCMRRKKVIFQLQQTYIHIYNNKEGRYDYYHNAFISSQEHIMLVINFSQVGHQRQHLHKCVSFLFFTLFPFFLSNTLFMIISLTNHIHTCMKKKSQLPASFVLCVCVCPTNIYILLLYCRHRINTHTHNTRRHYYCSLDYLRGHLFN